MYHRLWTSLPGPVAVRATLLAVAAVAAVVLLLGVLFPAVESLLPGSEVAFR